MNELEREFREVLRRDSSNTAELLMRRLTRHLGVRLERLADFARLTDEQLKAGVAYFRRDNYKTTLDVDRLAAMAATVRKPDAA